MIVPKREFSHVHVARHYDELDTFYRGIWGEHVHHGLWVSGDESRLTAVQQLVDVVASEAEIKFGDRVLDIGSGYGAAARQIAHDYGAHVVGITLSPAQHQYARQRQYPDGNPTFLLGDWMANDLPDESFDAVYAIECVSHMADVEHFFREAMRVLRPGGRLVVCAWMATEQPEPGHVRYLLEPICREGRLAHLSTAREYVEDIEVAGGRVAEFRDLTFNVRRTWPVALRRTLARMVSDPAVLRYLLRARSGQRVFLITMCRMWLAYRVGALRYGLVKAYRPLQRAMSANMA